MAKTNPGDVLTSDWNPIIGCVRYSAGCLNCWYLDAIFPWQQRLGNIPAFVDPSQSYLFESRLTASSLKAKRGIVGIIQHGDLFFDGNSDNIINKVLDIVDEVRLAKKTNSHLYALDQAGRAHGSNSDTPLPLGRSVISCVIHISRKPSEPQSPRSLLMVFRSQNHSSRTAP